MKKLGKYDVTEDVKRNVRNYLFKKLPLYNLVKVSRASNYPDDCHLYHVVAQHMKTNEFACWTCWDETTQSLDFGHYNLKTIKEVDDILDEFYNDVTK